MSDRIFASIWLLLSLAGLGYIYFSMDNSNLDVLGPRTYPIVIFVLMSLASLFLLLSPELTQPEWPRGKLLIKVIFMSLSLLLYSLFFETLGFPISTALLTFVLGIIFNGHWYYCMTSGITIGFSLYFIFDQLLSVTLPLGHLLTRIMS